MQLQHAACAHLCKPVLEIVLCIIISAQETPLCKLSSTSKNTSNNCQQPFQHIMKSYPHHTLLHMSNDSEKLTTYLAVTKRGCKK